MITRIIAGTIIGGIVLFLLGFLIYGLALESYMTANSNHPAGLMKTPPNFILLAIANLAFAFVVTFVAEHWARVRTFAGGLKVGAVIAISFSVWMNFLFETFIDFYVGYAPVAVDIISTTVIGAIAGGIIGLILGKMDKQT